MTINISVPEEMHTYLHRECGDLSVSEYIRSLVHRDRQRREDYRSRPPHMPIRAGDCIVISQALEQLEKLKAILKRTDTYDD